MLIFYYFLLVLVTGLICYKAYQIWARDYDFTIPIVVFFMLYFSIGGAYIYPIDQYFNFAGASIGLHYLPIFQKLFEVNFDWNYIISVGTYLLFILVFLQAYLFGISKGILHLKLFQMKGKQVNYRFLVNPYVVFTFTLFFVLLSFYTLRDEIFYAISNQKSIYLITRANTNRLYTIHQLANSFSVLIPFIAFSFVILKSNRFNIYVKNNSLSVGLILFSCILSALYIVLLGNRREVLSGIVICLLICLNSYKQINYGRLGVMLSICIVFFLANDFFRSTAIPKFLNESLNMEQKSNFVLVPKIQTEADKIDAIYQSKQAITSFLFSNELFYAHFSMYGVLDKKVPLTYGSSFLYLGTSLVPRILYADRPKDIYAHYASEVKATEGQIYTIHHAAGWYLNFGFIGVIIGAVLLASLFVLAFHLNRSTVQFSSAGMALLKFLLPFLLTAQIVTFITAGPEAYKALILEGVVIPVVLLYFCLGKKTMQTPV